MSTFNVSVTITLRNGILDVQGKTVENALHAMEYSGISGVRMGKHVTFSLTAGDSREAERIADEACSKLIANPIMEDYSVHIEEVA